MPYWRHWPDEIIFIQISPSALNAVPIYSSHFFFISNNNNRVSIQITMQLCHTCFKMIVYDSNVL